MPLQNYQYDTIMREYNRRQARNRRIQEEHLAEAYEKIPRLREIDEEVATLSARKARALISRQEVGIEDLRNDIALLSQERTALLLSSGYPADYLEMSYTCPLCQDTGYIGSQKCSCFKKAEIELLYTQSNLKEILEKENFDHFSFDFYSDTITNDSTGLTERETARRAYKMAKEFVADFDNSFQNLFFYGDTGVGKTFLSHCIAHELLESAHCVLYFSAFDLFDFLAGSAFSRKNDTPDDELIFDCDLLIIDDLGIERSTEFALEQVFNVIDSRYRSKLPLIVTTNMTLEELKNPQDLTRSRIYDRVLERCVPLRINNQNIRQRNAAESMKEARKILESGTGT